jgi:VWFA-related protein
MVDDRCPTLAASACSRKSASILIAATLSVAVLAQQKDPQKEQRPVFRGGTQLVRVDAYPTGKDGRILEGLTADAFEVFENGAPQKVETFEFDRFETWTPDGERKDPRTQQDAYDLAADPSWRVFVIVIDRAAYGTVEGQYMLRGPLHQFLDRELGPKDLFGLLTTENDWTDLTLGQTTTTANALLDRRDWLNSPEYEERLELERDCTGPRKRLDDTYTLFEGLVKLLGQVREEKKSILFVSNGLGAPRPGGDSGRGSGPFGLPIPAAPRGGLAGGAHPGPTGHGDAVGGRSPAQDCSAERMRLANIDFQQRFHDLLDDAKRANVAFYPISPRGLEAPPIHVNRPGPVSVAQTRGELDAITHRNDSLLTLADNTDGLAIVDTNDLGKGIRRIADDMSAYYILGYYPTNPKWDGTVRNIKVRLKSTGKIVRARHQYRAPTEAERSPPPAPPDPVTPDVRAALNRLTVSIDSRQHDATLPSPPAATLSSLVDNPVAVRRGSHDSVTPFAFDRTEQIRLEWQARGAVDRVEARLLDRVGHPLAAPIPATIDTSRVPAVIVAQLPLTALAHGDYIVELTVSSGSTADRSFAAFRLR